MTTTSQTDINTNTNIFTSSSIGAADDITVTDQTAAKGANKNFNPSSSASSFINNLNQCNNQNDNNGNSSRVTDTGKRKKLKSRNATVPNSSYSKVHLDAWLENCLKDTSNAQLSSSSEFLDYNPSTMKTGVNLESKNFLTHPHQQHQSSHTNLTNASNILGFNQQHYFGLQAVHHQQQQQQQRAALQNHVTIPSGYSGVPFSQGLQRNMPYFPKHLSAFNNRFPTFFPSGNGGFYTQNDGSQDFASLPPIVNMMGGSSELENHSTDVLNGSGSNPNISRGFRFSDPCLLNPSDNDSKISGQNTPNQHCFNASNDIENNRFFQALMEQINILHETNSKICRNLHDTKVDIEALKHAPNSWGRHRRESFSGLSTHSQPMIFNGGFGTQSPAPTYHSAYTPGAMADVVREVKEAARVREDALLNRVKAMVEERQWSLNESHLRIMRDIEALKSQIHKMGVDRKETNKRINQLEAENKHMRQVLSTMWNSKHSTDTIYEHETSKSYRPYSQSRHSQPFNVHCGILHHQPATTTSTLSLQEQEWHMRHVETSLNSSQQAKDSDARNSFSSSEGGFDSGRKEDPLTIVSPPRTNNGTHLSAGPLLSPPTFALVSSPIEETKKKIDKTSRQTEHEVCQTEETNAVLDDHMRRDLNEAVALRNEADKRIIALQKVIRDLQDRKAKPQEVVEVKNGDGNNAGVRNNNDLNKINLIPVLTSGTAMSSISKWQHPSNANFTTTSFQRHQQVQIASSNNVDMSQPQSKLSAAAAGLITDL